MPTITPFLWFDVQTVISRVMEAMIRMKIIDIAALERVAEA